MRNSKPQYETDTGEEIAARHADRDANKRLAGETGQVISIPGDRDEGQNNQQEVTLPLNDMEANDITGSGKELYSECVDKSKPAPEMQVIISQTSPSKDTANKNSQSSDRKADDTSKTISPIPSIPSSKSDTGFKPIQRNSGFKISSRLALSLAEKIIPESAKDDLKSWQQLIKKVYGMFVVRWRL